MFLDDIKKLGKGNMDGVSFWAYGRRLCDGEKRESSLGINPVLGIVGVVLLTAGCGRFGIGGWDSL